LGDLQILIVLKAFCAAVLDALQQQAFNVNAVPFNHVRPKAAHANPKKLIDPKVAL